MNRLLLFFVLLAVGVKAQIVNIPDPVFKAYLLTNFDTNSDGELQQSEANAISTINANNLAISDLTGIDQMPYLGQLSVTHANLTSVYIHDKYCDVNVSYNPNLVSLTLENMQMSILDFSHTPMSQLSFLGNVSIVQIFADYISGSGLPLDLHTVQNLIMLSANWSNVISVNISGRNILQFNVYSSALLSSVDMTNAVCNGTSFINCPQLTTLVATGASIGSLSFSVTGLTSLDLSTMTSLKYLIIESTPLTSLNLQNCTNLEEITLYSPILEVLDLSDCYKMEYVHAGQSVKKIYAKNGADEDFSGLNPSLMELMCVDPFQLADFFPVQVWDDVLTPYCSLLPGGNFNTVTGSVTFDLDADGCDPADPSQPLNAITLTAGTNQYVAFTLPNGTFSGYFPGNANFAAQYYLENPGYFTVTPPFQQISLSGSTTVGNLDFCVSPNGIHHDLEVLIAPQSVARPGFDVSYTITYRNKGNQVESGQVALQFNDNWLDFVTASVSPSNTATGLLGWTFTGLLPFETRTVTVTFHANSPTATPPLNIGDILVFDTAVSGIGTDDTANDNAFHFTHTVVGSWDPNDINCLEGTIVNTSLIGGYLHYTVNFENTGNYLAENVVINELLDTSKFDLASFQVLNSSHPIRVQRSNNMVEFFFEDINLAPQGRGQVTYKIKTKSSLITGSQVEQSAKIFFDYNPFIQTNTATTTFQQLSTTTPSQESFALWPNPASDVVTISGASEIESIAVLNLLGQEVYKQEGNGRGTQVNISSLPSGNYLVRVKAAGGEQLLKLVKK